jgi:circadian clock protein KaiC
MLMRLIDHLKTEGITALFTSLTRGEGALEHTDVAVSSLMDTWLVLRMLVHGGEWHRRLSVLKSRGMAHSSEIRELRLTDGGITLGPARDDRARRRPRPSPGRRARETPR